MYRESQVESPSILMMRWIGARTFPFEPNTNQSSMKSITQSSQSTTVTTSTTQGYSQVVGSGSSLILSGTLSSQLPWGLGILYAGRYGGPFLLVSIISSMNDIWMNTVFEAKHIFHVKHTSPIPKKTKSRSRTPFQAIEGDVIKYQVPVRHLSCRARFVPHHIHGTENRPIPSVYRLKPYETKEWISHDVDVRYLYNTMQITHVLLENGHLTHDTTNDGYPWMVWFFHDMYRKYRASSRHMVTTQGPQVLLRDLVNVVMEYLE